MTTPTYELINGIESQQKQQFGMQRDMVIQRQQGQAAMTSMYRSMQASQDYQNYRQASYKDYTDIYGNYISSPPFERVPDRIRLKHILPSCGSGSSKKLTFREELQKETNEALKGVKFEI